MSDKMEKLEKAKAFLRGEEDVLSEQPTDVTFWFYCDTEEDAYALAASLQKFGHGIDACEERDRAVADWLVISKTTMPVDSDRLEELMNRFEELASAHDARFDGWEAALDYDP